MTIHPHGFLYYDYCMKKKNFVRLSLLAALILAGCAAPAQTAVPVPSGTAKPAPAPTSTAEPTSTVPTPIEEPSKPFAYQFISMEMTDPEKGTAILMDEYNAQFLASTNDGGKTWNDISPTENEYILSSSFDQNGFGMVTTFTEEGNSKLWTTSDMGKTWLSSDLNEGMTGANITFNSENYALARVSEGAAGSVYTHFYESTDQGANWFLVPLIPPQPEENLEEGIIPLCNICGDILLQTETESLIVYGEMANEPSDVIRVATSLDRGSTWTDAAISKPEQHKNAFVLPLSTSISAELWNASIAFVSFDPVMSYSVFFLTSTDQGISWRLSPEAAFEQSELVESIETVGGSTAYQICGYDLCFIDLLSGQVNSTPLDVVWDNAIIKFPNNTLARFIDINTGWVIQNGSDASLIFFTEDGGPTWQTISPVFNQKDPA